MSIHPHPKNGSNGSLDASTFARHFHEHYDGYVGLKYHGANQQWQYLAKRGFTSPDGEHEYCGGDNVPLFVINQMMRLIIESVIERHGETARNPQGYILSHRNRCLRKRFISECCGMLPLTQADPESVGNH